MFRGGHLGTSFSSNRRNTLFEDERCLKLERCLEPDLDLKLRESGGPELELLVLDLVLDLGLDARLLSVDNSVIKRRGPCVTVRHGVAERSRLIFKKKLKNKTNIIMRS